MKVQPREEELRGHLVGLHELAALERPVDGAPPDEPPPGPAGHEERPVDVAVTLGAYALEMSVLMVTVSLLSALGRAGVLRVLQRNTGRVSRVAGALLALAGVAQLYLFVFDWLGILRLL